MVCTCCRLSVLWALVLLAAPLGAAAEEQRLGVGEFTATRFATSPVIDGVAGPGEWDRALTTEGMMAPFEHELHESVTVMSLGFDAERLYFLMRCTRGNAEWRLPKYARQNDDYNYGEPSVEIWVTPPAAVPETYQNIINTYPAVMDVKMIPSRGYTGMGWKADWKVAVRETDADYVIEASVPIKDFGRAAIASGDVWRFLLGRTCHGAKPRAQASWSVTQGFAEIPGHIPVHLVDDEAVLQLTGVHTVFTGKYEFPIGVVAPRAGGADVDVEVRFHQGKTPGPGDKVEKKRVSVKAGGREVVAFAGDVSDWKQGHVTVTGTKAGGTLIFRQSFAFPVSGWKPRKPARPAGAVVEELAVSAQYGP
ncbi:MAG: hypothetical protein IMZ66_11080, partial [Planctomycetes bacterium]|nr:hypothetical protein [Planctomycetota bacterium]